MCKNINMGLGWGLQSEFIDMWKCSHQRKMVVYAFEMKLGHKLALIHYTHMTWKKWPLLPL
jgi:hypothetical protein